MRIYDVMPTLLAAYGYRVNGEIDGRISETAVSLSDYKTVDELSAPASDLKSNERDKEYTGEIEEQLESLGYLQ
jgi:arylsulfatase A-like enzyme